MTNRSRLNYLHGNPRIKARHAKLARLKRKGLLMSLEELRAHAQEAMRKRSHSAEQCKSVQPRQLLK